MSTKTALGDLTCDQLVSMTAAAFDVIDAILRAVRDMEQETPGMASHVMRCVYYDAERDALIYDPEDEAIKLSFLKELQELLK